MTTARPPAQIDPCANRSVLRWLALIFLRIALGAAAAQGPAPASQVETIVFIRHGEKPANDDGQLTCQGLNRALALPAVLDAKFGRPDFIFAPLTTKKKSKEGTFSYVRPLITIEPTAIRAGLPVETRIAYDDLGSLQGELCEKQYQRATIFVAWEHKQIDEVVRRMVSAFGGDEKDVPDWPPDDFDSIFVVRLHDDPQGKKSITFEHDHEGLNGLSADYPAVKAK